MSPSLSVVAHNDLKSVLPKIETVGQRVQRLQAEARQLAKDHVRSLTAAMASLEAMAAEIADGGDAYAPGIRDIARRMAEELEARARTLDAISART